MKVLGLDLSLTATGCAAVDLFGGGIACLTISPPKGMTGLERLDWICRQVLTVAEPRDLIVFEGFSFGSNDPGTQERIGLAFLLRHWAWKRGVPFLCVAPSQLKKFATGKGNAEKSMILREVFRRWNVEARNDNEADAVTLLQIGRCLAGEIQPETVPQREVLEALRKSGAVPKLGAAA